MAIAKIFIPDGKFCGDQEHLGCKFETHMEGFHWCSLYNESIGKIQDIYVNGEHYREFLKCDKCLERMLNDGGKGLEEDEI
jgi:hypothetical protein